MKTPAVLFALAALIFVGSAASAATAPTVTLKSSTLTFKQAISACPGALGTVTFTLGHSRVASLPGVSEQVDTSASGIDAVTFENAAGKSAVVTTNGHKNTVTAKNVQVKWKEQLACVMPD